MRNMVGWMDESNMVEEYNVRWGALVIISEKTTSGKCAMEKVIVKDVFFLWKTEPVHLPICFPYSLLKWRGV